MDRSEMLALATRMLKEARALRAAFPDADALEELPISPPAGAAGEDEKVIASRAALRYLRDEMLLVRSGKAGSLSVLDDEIAYAESLLPRQCPQPA